MDGHKEILWKLLWDYDPNGLVVVDLEMKITLVNEAFCTMFRQKREDLIGKEAGQILGDMSDFRYVWDKNTVIKAKEKAFSQYDLYVRQVIFPIKAENIIACIVVDVTHEWKQKNEFNKLKAQTLEKLNQVVDKQMHTAQEIAGLLGESTAETKVSLIKVLEMLKEEK